MAKKLHANMITAGDIKKRHPRYLNCETDKQYAELAKEIYDVIYDELDFMDDWQIKNASISQSLYFEDLHSGTHLFETFTKLYKNMTGSSTSTTAKGSTSSATPRNISVG